MQSKGVSTVTGPESGASGIRCLIDTPDKPDTSHPVRNVRTGHEPDKPDIHAPDENGRFVQFRPFSENGSTSVGVTSKHPSKNTDTSSEQHE
jgi:hypothetical protein